MSMTTTIMEPSSSKRLKMNTSSTETENQDTKACFHSLPTEIFLNIMSYLDVGDQREGRLVCRRWNNTLSSWDEFMNKFRYLLRRSPSTNTYSTLRDSTGAWKHVVLAKINPGKSPDWYFPSYLNETLSSVVLIDGVLSWGWVKELAARFPSLDELAIVNCERMIEKDDGWFQTPEQFLGFNELAEKLKELKIELTENLLTLNFYLKQFASPISSLVKLEFSVTTVHPLHYYPEPDAQERETNLSGFVELISSCRSTLKSLIIRAREDHSGAPVTFLKALTDKKITLALDTLHVYWDENAPILRRAGPAERHFLEYVRSQPNLKSLNVPMFGIGRQNIVPPPPDLALSLPNQLKHIELGCVQYLTVQVFELLLETKVLVINVQEDLPPGLLQEAVDERVFPELESLTISGIRHLNLRYSLVVSIVNTFPHLEYLSLVCQDASMDQWECLTDEALQAIIGNLWKLKVLRLDKCETISDVGVSGIPSGQAEDLQRSRTVYLGEDLAALNIARTGRPLSSLQNLQELLLRGASSLITDVGIHYGFGFKCLKKLEVVTGDKMSDWGLCQFGKLNRNMESCSIFTTSTIISPVAKTLLQRSLPRVFPRNLNITTIGIVANELDPELRPRQVATRGRGGPGPRRHVRRRR